MKTRPFETEWSFDQLGLNGFGAAILIAGTATLQHVEGDDTFIVDHIQLENKTLSGTAEEPDFDQLLFSMLSRSIEHDQGAIDAFNEELADARKPDPDLARDEMKDRSIHFNE